MYFDKTKEENSIIVRMVGKFTHKDKDNFLKLIDALEDQQLSDLVLDFSFVEFIDSSAMGLLLLLRKESEKRGINTRLANVTGQVWKVINISHFDKLFTVTPLETNQA